MLVVDWIHPAPLPKYTEILPELVNMALVRNINFELNVNELKWNHLDELWSNVIDVFIKKENFVIDGKEKEHVIL